MNWLVELYKSGIQYLLENRKVCKNSKSKTRNHKLFCSLDRNRTCIWSFGNSYTIHCTTRPNTERKRTKYQNTNSKRQVRFWNLVIGFCFLLFYQSPHICTKHFYSNGQQYYAKKFSYGY